MTIATTGIAGLDAQLGGGIPRGTTLLLMGEPGNAIPLFCEQFAGGGLDIGDDVLYFEFDRPTVNIRQNIQSFVLRGNEKKAELTLHDGYVTQFNRGKPSRSRDSNALALHPGAAFSTVLGAVEDRQGKRPHRLVIETLSSLVRDSNERDVLDFTRQLTFLGHEHEGLHVVSMIKGLHSPAFENQMRHLCGGVIEFGSERKGFGIYNYLLVSKLLDVKDPVKILLWKETEKGLWLESTKRVF